MTLGKTLGVGVIAILLTALFTGCLVPMVHEDRPIENGMTPVDYVLRPDSLVVFFFRESSYKGLGRMHELYIDGNPVGSLTADNYYRIELWPGEYQFSVHLPAEDFFGSHSPPENTMTRLVFGKSKDTGIFVYKYVDGEGIFRIEPVDDAVIARIRHSRMLSANPSARDTAQVKFLYDARYDGPAALGKAHGYGMLTWNDGSIFRGRFEYGETTEEGEFLTTDGRIYMGPYHKGRPIGPGVWMTWDRRILYAGPFKDERPHGTGLRSGTKAPEFCNYENGRDITKTMKEMAREAVDEEDKRIEEEKSAAVAPASANRTDQMAVDPEKKVNAAVIEEKSPALPAAGLPASVFSTTGQEAAAATVTSKGRPDMIKPKLARSQRILARYRSIEQRIEKQLEEKRMWCREEFALGRQLCECAPFAVEFEQWRGCVDR